MQNEEPLSFEFAGVPAYDFTLEEATGTIYAFTTVNGVFYEVRFKPSGYVFSDYSWKDTVFEIIIDLVFAPDPDRIPSDRSIQATIIKIVADFFTVHERVILYICDDSDSREMARKRKFDTWYARYGTRLFVKYDLPPVADQSERFFASIFCRRDNPNRFAVIDAFDRLLAGEK